MPDIETAIEIALEGHRGQTDKAGEAYILHPLRVMGAFTDSTHRIVGVLHDVVEDTRFSLSDITARGFGEEVCDAIDAITKRDGEAYPDYLARVASNPVARSVKLADIGDNRGRLDNLSEPQRSTLDAKYRTALDFLTL